MDCNFRDPYVKAFARGGLLLMSLYLGLDRSSWESGNIYIYIYIYIYICSLGTSEAKKLT